MIWNAGDGVIRIADAAGTTVTRAAVAGPREARRSLEQALPGEWAALVVILAVIAVIGAAILLATCLGHERVVARRRAQRTQRARWAQAAQRAQPAQRAMGNQRRTPTRTAT